MTRVSYLTLAPRSPMRRVGWRHVAATGATRDVPRARRPRARRRCMRIPRRAPAPSLGWHPCSRAKLRTQAWPAQTRPERARPSCVSAPDARPGRAAPSPTASRGPRRSCCPSPAPPLRRGSAALVGAVVVGRGPARALPGVGPTHGWPPAAVARRGAPSGARGASCFRLLRSCQNLLRYLLFLLIVTLRA